MPPFSRRFFQLSGSLGIRGPGIRAWRFPGRVLQPTSHKITSVCGWNSGANANLHQRSVSPKLCHGQKATSHCRSGCCATQGQRLVMRSDAKNKKWSTDVFWAPDLSKVSDPVNPYGWMINPAIAESSTAKGGLFHRISGNVPSFFLDRRLCRVWIIGSCFRLFQWTVLPIGSMYAIYGNIYHQYTPNVSIYTIHGSYGLEKSKHFLRFQISEAYAPARVPMLNRLVLGLISSQSTASRTEGVRSCPMSRSCSTFKRASPGCVFTYFINCLVMSTQTYVPHSNP